jgi:hypothetical protein
MEHVISGHQLRQVCQLAAELGAIAALIKTGKLKPYLSKAEAFRAYGRANVERWINEGHIVARKDGNHSANWRVDRLEVEAIVKSMAIIRYP